MSESNYHGRMMNIAVVLRQMLETTTNPYLDDVETYKLGHRDARHAAAEIAAEADARIASLETQLAAAQERERDFAEWVWQAVYHEQREAGEFRDDAKAEADRVVARIRGEVADEVATASSGGARGSD